MDLGNWHEIKIILHNEIEKIFKNHDISLLSKYEMRKIIFKYLTETIIYDFELLEKIKQKNSSKNKISRNPYEEIKNVLYNKKGICNSIAQYYKLLLEEVGIYSMCVICDDLTEVNHQLNLVYDEVNDCYSFDDITSVIVNKGDINQYFDYDLESANSYGQGTKFNQANELWTVWPTSIIHFIVGKEDNRYLKYSNVETAKIEQLNISKNKKSKKII